MINRVTGMVLQCSAVSRCSQACGRLPCLPLVGMVEEAAAPWGLGQVHRQLLCERATARCVLNSAASLAMGSLSDGAAGCRRPWVLPRFLANGNQPELRQGYLMLSGSGGSPSLGFVVFVCWARQTYQTAGQS